MFTQIVEFYRREKFLGGDTEGYLFIVLTNRAFRSDFARTKK